MNNVPLSELVKRVKVGYVGTVDKYYCEPDGGVKIYRPTDITPLGLSDYGVRYITKEFHEKNKKSQVHYGDIIISRCGKDGIPVIYDSHEPAQVLNAVIIEPNQEKMSSEAIHTFLRSPTAQVQISNLTSGSVQGVINTEMIASLLVPLNLDYSKISSFLFGIDSKISNNNAICADLEIMAKLLYDYWFVQFDFPDENGKPYKSSGGKMVWNEELKREIPEKWKASRFEECIASINTGLNPRDNFKLNTGGNIKYLTVKNLTKDGTIDFSSCDTIDEEARTVVHKRSDIKVGDILFASIAPLGRCSIIAEPPTDWDINESIFSLRPNCENMTSIFLYMTFMSDAFVKKAEGSSAGSVFKGIRISELQDLLTILPPKNVLDRFDKQVEKLFALKSNAITENQQLESLRDFLLPMLMNGQVKVG